MVGPTNKFSKINCQGLSKAWTKYLGMPVLSVSDIHLLQELCNMLHQQEEVRFAGIINQMGNLIAGGFKEGVEPYANYSRQHMMYMQLVLELKMRKEFDDILGPVNYMHSKRDNVSMLSIPKEDFVVVVSLEKDTSIEKVVDLVEEYFMASKVSPADKFQAVKS